MFATEKETLSSNALIVCKTLIPSLSRSSVGFASFNNLFATPFVDFIFTLTPADAAVNLSYLIFAVTLKASNEFWTASNANSPALTLVVTSEKSSIKVVNSFVKIFSAPFLLLIILPPPNKDFSATFSKTSMYLLSLPIPGVINPSAASSILDVPFWTLPSSS